jgi:hypothetical protein
LPSALAAVNCDAIKQGAASLVLGLPAGANALHAGLLLRTLRSATLGQDQNMAGTLLIQLLSKLRKLPGAHACRLVDLVPHLDARVRDLATEVLRAQPSALLPHVRLLIRAMGLSCGGFSCGAPAALLFELEPSVLAPHVPLLLVAFENEESSSAARELLETVPIARSRHTMPRYSTCSWSHAGVLLAGSFWARRASSLTERAPSGRGLF